MEQLLNGNQQQLPPVGRRPKKANGTAVGLFGSLTQSLQQGLYSGLFEGVSPVQSTFVPNTGAPSSPSTPGSSLSGAFVRHISLLSGEDISHTFSPDDGLILQPVAEGQMLVLTNLRVMTFGQKEGVQETVLVPLEEVKAVSVTAGQRSKGTLFQGGMMIVAAVFFYVLLAYWLTGRIDGPTVPVIRMDLVAFVVFLAILTGVTMLAQMYFAKPDGEVTFQGDGVKFTFPFRGETSEEEMYTLVNAAFAARQTVVGPTQAPVIQG
jgi:hypothetical protein